LAAGAIVGAAPHAPWKFYNRGVKGDKVPDLQARWAEDAIALKPDVLSVLVGVNDYWHHTLRGYTGTVADYEAQYIALLTETRRALPNIRFVVLEPFVLRFGYVKDSWFPEFDVRRAAAARVAQHVGATFIPLQSVFDQLAAETRPEDWASDGVHPTLAGHAVIAAHWRAATGL